MSVTKTYTQNNKTKGNKAKYENEVYFNQAGNQTFAQYTTLEGYP